MAIYKLAPRTDEVVIDLGREDAPRTAANLDAATAHLHDYVAAQLEQDEVTDEQVVDFIREAGGSLEL